MSISAPPTSRWSAPSMGAVSGSMRVRGTSLVGGEAPRIEECRVSAGETPARGGRSHHAYGGETAGDDKALDPWYRSDHGQAVRGMGTASRPGCDDGDILEGGRDSHGALRQSANDVGALRVVQERPAERRA